MDEEDIYTVEAIKFLQNATDADWLCFACSSNYDFNPDVLKWASVQSGCPASTALAIYWHMDPGYYEQYRVNTTVPDWESDAFELIRIIERNYVAGFYKTSNVGFDPSRDDSSGGLENWTDGRKDSSFIPSAMKIPCPGEHINILQLTHGWIEGLPPQVAKIVFPNG